MVVAAVVPKNRKEKVVGFFKIFDSVIRTAGESKSVDKVLNPTTDIPPAKNTEEKVPRINMSLARRDTAEMLKDICPYTKSFSCI